MGLKGNSWVSLCGSWIALFITAIMFQGRSFSVLNPGQIPEYRFKHTFIRLPKANTIYLYWIASVTRFSGLPACCFWRFIGCPGGFQKFQGLCWSPHLALLHLHSVNELATLYILSLIKKCRISYLKATFHQHTWKNSIDVAYNLE